MFLERCQLRREKCKSSSAPNLHMYVGIGTYVHSYKSGKGIDFSVLKFLPLGVKSVDTGL